MSWCVSSPAAASVPAVTPAALSLQVYDISKDAVASLQAAGAQRAETIQDIAKGDE